VVALPPESKHEQISAMLREVLAAIDHEAAPTDFWHTPDRVVRVDDFLVEHLRPEWATVYQLRPGDEFVREQPTQKLEREAEFFILAARKYSWPTRKGHFGNAALVEDRPVVDGACVLAQPVPEDPAPVRLTLTDEDRTITAGTATLVGVDHSGAALSIDFNLATRRQQYSTDAMASCTSCTFSGVVGATPKTSVRVDWFLTKSTVQDRLVRDAVKKLLQDIRLGGLTFNLELPDISRDIFVEGAFPWAAVELRVIARYQHHVVAP